MSAALRRIAPLPTFLFEPRRPWLVIPVAVAASLFGAILLGALVAKLLPSLSGPTFDIGGMTFLVAVVVVAPLIETAIMAGVLEILRRIVPPWAAVALSSIGWGLAHSSAAPAWGLVIWWPFLIFSTLYMVWRERSVLAAFGMAASVHALQNAVPALGVAFN